MGAGRQTPAERSLQQAHQLIKPEPPWMSHLDRATREAVREYRFATEWFGPSCEGTLPERERK